MVKINVATEKEVRYHTDLYIL